MRTSRRYQIRLAPPLESALENFAREHGLGLCASIRFLVSRGLEAEMRRLESTDGTVEAAVALAALTAAEHAILMVASVLPEGERRMRSLAERAAEAAEERLAMFRRPRSEEPRE